MEHTNRAVPASYLILEKNGKVLMSRRKNTNYQCGSYQLPAGHIDEGELPIECIIREAKEEVGIIISRADLEFVHVSYRPKHDNTADRVDFFFRARKWQGNISNPEPEKSTDWEWVSYGKIPENSIPHVKDALECISKKVFFKELDINFLKASKAIAS